MSTPYKFSTEQNEFFLENNILITDLEKLHKGLSNYNFILNGDKLLKINYDSRFKGLSLEQLAFQNEAADDFLSPRGFFTNDKLGMSLGEYIKGYEPINPSSITVIQAKNIIQALKNIHSLPCMGLKELDYEKTLDFYRLYCPVKERKYIARLENSPLLKSEKEVTHFDLTSDNLLADKMEHILIIDYEFACLAPKYFDLVSLLYESDYSDAILSLFIEEYFKEDEKGKEAFLAQKDELRALADLLWYHWALARSSSPDKEMNSAFKKIKEDKEEALNRYLGK